jgi:hypothetical protein
VGKKRKVTLVWVVVRRHYSYVLLLAVLLIIQFSMAPFQTVHTTALESVNSSLNDLKSNQNRFYEEDVRFGRNVRVIDHSAPYPIQVEPTMTVLSTGRILVGWKEAQTHSGPGYRVGFAYSTDEGHTFSPNILMDPTTPGHRQSDPWLVADHQDNAYFVFLDFADVEAGASGIGVAKTTDGGDTWFPTVDASDTPGFDDKETACVDAQGNLYIIWDEYIDPANTLRFTKSTDGGVTFQPTTSPFGPYIPYITCSENGTLFVTTDDWSGLSGTGNEVWIARSDDGGATWTPKITVTPPGIEEVAIITVVDTDSQFNVYVAYAAGSQTDKEIYIVKSTDGGYTWNPPVRVNTVTSGMQRMVEMVIDENDTIHVAWLDGQHSDWDIYYSYSEDGGATFSPNVRVTSESTPSMYWRPGDYFTMRISPNGKVNIVWTDGRGEDLDIYFVKQDIAAPLLTHIPPFLAYQQSPLTIIANATDDDYVEVIELNYQIAGSPNWHTLLMDRIDSNTFQGTIAPTQLVGGVLNYYLVARDAAGRETSLPGNDTDWYTIPLQSVTPSLIITIIASVAIIAITIVFAVWYLRRTPGKESTE